MTTKLILCAGLAAGITLQLCPSVLANSVGTPYTFSSGTLNKNIPDGDNSGVASHITVAGTLGSIDSVTLTLDVTGVPDAGDALNGDYYAYLQFGSSPLVVLLDRIDGGSGGNPGSGFNVTFDDSAATSIQNASQTSGVPLTGSYQPKGSLGSLDGLGSANGLWTLFIADESGVYEGELQDWSLTVNVSVPDHGGTMLLLATGVGFLGLYALRHQRTAPISLK